MNNFFGIVKKLSDDLFVLQVPFSSTRSDPQAMWAKSVVRKEHQCVACGRNYPKGTAMFAPVGNHDYRMNRICSPCIKGGQ